VATGHLSDEAWAGRLTAREIQSRLVDAPGDRHAKEVRRLAKKLGIRLAKDQRGRKRKPYLPKREPKQPKRPRGRPRTKPEPELEFTGDIDKALSKLFRKSQGKPERAPSKNQFWNSTEARRTAAQKRSPTLKAKREKQRQARLRCVRADYERLIPGAPTVTWLIADSHFSEPLSSPSDQHPKSVAFSPRGVFWRKMVKKP
jgi:hypothetical protein